MDLIPKAPAAVVPSSRYFTESADFEKGFADFYEENIRPLVRQMEELRLQKIEESKKIRPKANLLLYGSIALGIVLTYLAKNVGVLIFIVMLAAFFRYAMINQSRAQFNTEFKAKIIPKILEFFGDYQYQKSTGIPVDVIRQSQLFDSFNTTHFDDSMTGKYRNKNIQFTEAALVQSGGKNSTTIFNGKIILLELDRSIGGKIIVKRESQKGLWEGLTGKSHGLKKVAIPDSEFEKIFEVYAENENEAQTVVTPEFTQKLLLLEQSKKAPGIRFSFFENKVLIAFGPSMLEVNLFEPSAMQGDMEGSMMDDVHKFLQQFHDILEILDALNMVKTI